MRTAIFNGFAAIQIKACMLILVDKIIQGFMILFLTEYDFITIHIDQCRTLCVFKIKSIFFFFQPNLPAGFCTSFVNIYSEGYPKYLSGLLRLIHKNARGMFLFVIMVTDIQYRMTTSKIPLVPVPVQVLSCNLFKDHAQGMCFSAFKCIIRQVKS